MTKKMVITSSSNKIFKELISLHTNKGIQKNGFFLLCGQKLVDEALASKKYKVLIDSIVFPAKELRNYSFSIKEPSAYKSLELSTPLFSKLDTFGTNYPILKMKNPNFLKVQDVMKTHPEAKDFLGVVLPLQNPENLGAAIRSVAAFGAHAIFLTKESANPLLPKSLRASGLTVLELPICVCEDLTELSSLKLPWIGLDAGGSSISNFKFPKRGLIVVGKEGEGLKNFEIEKFQLIRIPISNYVESLNATVAISIVLYVWQSQRSL